MAGSDETAFAYGYLLQGAKYVLGAIKAGNYERAIKWLETTLEEAEQYRTGERQVPQV